MKYTSKFDNILGCDTCSGTDARGKYHNGDISRIISAHSCFLIGELSMVFVQNKIKSTGAAFSLQLLLSTSLTTNKRQRFRSSFLRSRCQYVLTVFSANKKI